MRDNENTAVNILYVCIYIWRTKDNIPKTAGGGEGWLSYRLNIVLTLK
jgi:hypothetical protein